MQLQPGSGLSPAAMAILGGIMIFSIFVVILGYVIESLVLFRLFKKAHVRHAWLAWIPIGNLWPLFDTVQIRKVHILWLLVPIVLGGIALSSHSQVFLMISWILDIAPLVVSILVIIRLLRAFHMRLWWMLLLIGFILPILNILVGIAWAILFLYMAYSSKVQYDATFNHKF